MTVAMKLAIVYLGYTKFFNLMRLFPLVLVSLLCFIAACSGNKREHQGHENGSDDVTDNPNQALYNEVMNIHDEVMPKMDDIYKLKVKLQDKLDSASTMSAEEKIKLQQRIAHLDSVGNLMMDWMHKFDPLPDSSDREEAREYLESEMEKIRKVKDAMLEAIEKEKK